MKKIVCHYEIATNKLLHYFELPNIPGAGNALLDGFQRLLETPIPQDIGDLLNRRCMFFVRLHAGVLPWVVHKDLGVYSQLEHEKLAGIFPWWLEPFYELWEKQLKLTLKVFQAGEITQYKTGWHWWIECLHEELVQSIEIESQPKKQPSCRKRSRLKALTKTYKDLGNGVNPFQKDDGLHHFRLYECVCKWKPYSPVDDFEGSKTKHEIEAALNGYVAAFRTYKNFLSKNSHTGYIDGQNWFVIAERNTRKKVYPESKLFCSGRGKKSK